MDELVTKYHMRQGNNWGVGILIMNDKNQVLLELRNDTHNWATPGGKVDFGETVEEGLKREVKEETNLKLKSYKFIEPHVGAFHREKIWISFLFMSKDFSGTIKPQASEMDKLEWVDADKVKDLDIFEPTKALLDSCKEHGLISWW